jgi:hypothetical protein
MSPIHHAEIWPASEWVAQAWNEVLNDYATSDDPDAFLQQLRAEAQSDGVVLVDLDELREDLDAALAEQE